MQISVIIPAYNAAKYLNRCIESVANQDLPYDCYEAIVINDGSTDESIEILNTLCEKYSFLKYIDVENAGVSCARNKGILEACGEYLLFLDADDCFYPNVFERIYKEMSDGKLDMMLLNYKHISLDGSFLEQPYHMELNDSNIISGREFLLRDFYPAMVPLYVYKRTFLIANQLKMIPIRHEDEEFVPRAIFYANRMKYLPLCFYSYFQNSGSFMNQYCESNALYMVAAMVSLNNFKITVSNDPKIVAYFDDHIAVIIMRLFKNSIRCGEGGQADMIKKIKEGGLLPLKPRKTSFYYWMFNMSPFFFERYYRFIKQRPKK